MLRIKGDYMILLSFMNIFSPCSGAETYDIHKKAFRKPSRVTFLFLFFFFLKGLHVVKKKNICALKDDKIIHH